MSADKTPSQMFDELRLMALNLKPNDIGLTKKNFPHPVYALVMETGYPEGSFTLSAIADGSTSLYFSNGGGVIGGREHDNVREASSYLLTLSQDLYTAADPVIDFPKPEPDTVNFYFLTFEGVYSSTGLEDELGNNNGPLSDLFLAAHRVITELRTIDEQ